jgi:hypothetical protein
MSTYIKLSTLEYPRHIGDIEIDPAGMADYAPVEWVEPPNINPKRERLSNSQPLQQEGRWVTNWAITPIPDSEGAKSVREQRNQKLKDTDWTQIADAPVDKAAWATYRQALRDVPSQAGFPWDIQWPTQPK